MFRKKYQEKEKKDTFYSGHNPLAKEHQCWKRHHSAGVPSPFCKVCQKSLCLSTQELWCFTCLESPIFSSSISPSFHLRNYDFKHQLLFLLPFLVPHHHDYCLSSATKDFCNTLLLLLQNNSDQAEKHLSTHLFLLNRVQRSLS